MEKTHRDPAAVRHEGDHESAGNSPHGADPIGASAASQQRAGLNIQTCTYCGEVVIRGERRHGDTIIAYLHGAATRVFWNGSPLIVREGICESCRAAKFPETVPR